MQAGGTEDGQRLFRHARRPRCEAPSLSGSLAGPGQGDTLLGSSLWLAIILSFTIQVAMTLFQKEV